MERIIRLNAHSWSKWILTKRQTNFQQVLKKHTVWHSYFWRPSYGGWKLSTLESTTDTVSVTRIQITGLVGVVQFPGHRDYQVSALLPIVFGDLWSHCYKQRKRKRDATASQNCKLCGTNKEHPLRSWNNRFDDKSRWKVYRSRRSAF